MARDVQQAGADCRVRAVRRRLRCYPHQGQGQPRRLWFGTNPMDASRWGIPVRAWSRCLGGGTTVSGRFLQACVWQQGGYLIRTSSKHFNPDDYPGIDGGRARVGSWLDNRFPLAKAKVSLEDAEAPFTPGPSKTDEAPADCVQQEMNFELHKYLKGARVLILSFLPGCAVRRHLEEHLRQALPSVRFVSRLNRNSGPRGTAGGVPGTGRV